jgi:hypothetical protein
MGTLDNGLSFKQTTTSRLSAGEIEMEYLIKVKTDGEELHRVLVGVSNALYSDEIDGEVPGGEFELIEYPSTDLVKDFRQRQAAAVLLLGYDLPVELGDHAKQMIFSSLVAPGLSTGHIPNANENGRETALKFARDLIDEMLAEKK